MTYVLFSCSVVWPGCGQSYSSQPAGHPRCQAFLGFLGKAVRRFGWSLTAWVLMTNHFHLVVQTPEPNLSRGMHWLNSYPPTTARCAMYELLTNGADST
jgi:hypothetical protein